MQNRFALFAFFGIVAFLFACGAVKKTQECNALIEKINSAQQEAEKVTSSSEPSAADMKKFADLLDKLATDIKGMDISTEELKGYANEYGEMASKTGLAARKVAEALETKDLEKANAAQKEFQGISGKEDALVDKINTFCGAP